MRVFILVGLFVATASAGSGYNYGPGLSGTYQSSANPGTIRGDELLNGGVQVNGDGLFNGGQLVGGIGLGGQGGIVNGKGLLNRGDFVSRAGLVSGAGLVNRGGLVSGGSRIVNGGLIASGSSYGGNSVYQTGSNYQSGNSGLVGPGGLISGGSRGIGGVLSSASQLSGGAQAVGPHAFANVPQTVELSKQFFYYNAPQEAHAEGVNQQQVSNTLKKNLQVIFIKTPENNAATNAALQLAKQAIEQRTAIYVLTKENDASQFVAQLQQIQESVPTKPEVKFVKYRTEADLQNAKAAIQAQYDNIGGTSEVFNGGVAPVLNYASQGRSHSGPGVLAVGGIGSSVGNVVGGGVKYVSNGGNSYSGSQLGSGIGSSNGNVFDGEAQYASSASPAISYNNEGNSFSSGSDIDSSASNLGGGGVNYASSVQPIVSYSNGGSSYSSESGSLPGSGIGSSVSKLVGRSSLVSATNPDYLSPIKK